MELLKLLKAMFGQKYLNKTIGTGTNVSKPIKMDKNSPFKLYSDSAFDNPDVLKFIEKKLAEYGPYALSNKNMTEVKNFEMNARRYLNKKQQTTKSDKPTPKPEAEIVDITTQQKVKPEGIMRLKTELGLPEGVEPGSLADKAIKESAEYKMDQQGVKSILDENYKPPKTTSLEDEMDNVIGDMMAKGYSAAQEGKRRAVIRQILLKDTRIDLPEDVRNSLKNYDDLRGGGDQNMDPLKVFERYYERDNEVLGTLDGIIDTAENEFKAADTFLSAEDNFKVKKPVVRESIDDEAVEVSETSELPDSDDDIPFAQGGRVGFAGGGIKALIAMMNKKFGKDAVKTADQVVVPDEVLSKTQRELQELDELRELYDNPMNFVKTVTPKFYERMELKIKYPGITDELIEKIMIDDNPQRKAEVLATLDEAFKMMEKGMSSDAILNAFKKTPRTKNAGGGLNYLMGM